MPTWLEGAGNRVSGALDGVLCLLEGGLLGVRLEVGLELVGGALAAARVSELLTCPSRRRWPADQTNNYKLSVMLAVLSG